MKNWSKIEKGKKSEKGELLSMNEIIPIPEFNFQLHITAKEIRCYDQLTKTLLDSKKLSYREIEHVRPKADFDNFLLRDSRGNNFDLQVLFVKEVNHLETNAEYISDFCMDTPDHGYYFGVYEIGEFSLKEHELKLNRSYDLKYCNTGIITPDGNIFLGIRESKTLQGPHDYFLYKLS